MEAKTKKAYDRLKEFETFSDEFETFKGFFYDNLKDGKQKEAIDVLLMACFWFLKSDGERFNTLLSRVEEQKKVQLKKWLDDTLERLGK